MTLPGKVRHVKDTRGQGMHDVARTTVSKVDKDGKFIISHKWQRPQCQLARALPEPEATPPTHGEQGAQMSKLTGIELLLAPQPVPSAMFAYKPGCRGSIRGAEPAGEDRVLLRRWEFDARQSSEASRTLAVSDERRLLQAVRSALAELGAPADPPQVQPMPVAVH